MTRRALSVCSCTGCPACGDRCPEIVPQGRCTDCSRAADRRRGSGAARGYTKRWAVFSKRYLRKHPICECRAPWCEHAPGLCGGKSTDPDHIDGSGRNGPRAFDETNLIALCHPCHSRKTTRQDGGFGR
jgi:5-methylcytosine-specific restriction protein A